MTKLTEFLVRCRMTGMVSNQIMLKIIKISLKSDNLKGETFNLLKNEWGLEKFNQFLLLLDNHTPLKIMAINYLDDEYPQLLRTIYNPPALLFFEGNIALLKTDCIAIVGSRQATNYSFRCISSLVPSLVNRYTIVSGLANGADSMANEEALMYGKTIAVLGSGLDVAYPAKNYHLQRMIAQKGLLITEYPIGNSIEPWHFPQRNRIIAGLSQKLIVTEAKERSGSLITADLALENNREVLALPGRLGDELSVGCNMLIEQGATPLLNLKKI
ncbi:DNA-processing protein DprA [Companilactobacillus musae]|uniref:DNA-processing protein DprA n=1 Tax=Companilactobacillus musae TaxID=1903258 RepID=UPI000E649CCE|nr:DNA-processing protein DprA [Companilactobacillus musae]